MELLYVRYPNLPPDSHLARNVSKAPWKPPLRKVLRNRRLIGWACNAIIALVEEHVNAFSD